MSSIRVNPVDHTWLLVESPETPMHVSALSIFSPPPGADADCVTRLVARLRGAAVRVPPWSCRLEPSTWRRLARWNTDGPVDLEHHVRHAAVAGPGRDADLWTYICRVHGEPLDFTRPLWEVHVVDGLERGRFALYTKMHHALIDGASAVRMIHRMMTEDPDARGNLPPWAAPAPARERAKQSSPLRERWRAPVQLARGVGRLFASARGGEGALLLPFAAPMSALNGRIGGARSYAAHAFALERVKALARAADATVNDVVLALCGAALRRLLGPALPVQSLTAGIPVNIRPAEDQTVGTVLACMLAPLATGEADPVRRLRAIRDATRREKQHLQQMPREALAAYTFFTMAPYAVTLLLGLAGRIRPPFNVGISNVVISEKPLYFDGARCEAMYPVSLVAHGQALNITCVSYAGVLSLGYTGARDSLPELTRLPEYAAGALEELEAALASPSATYIQS